MPRALIIEKEPLDLIFARKKLLELRRRNTKTRGKIGLIQKGTKTIVGSVDVVGVISFRPFQASHTLILKNPKRFRKPISYRHKSGAVTWVKIPRLPK
jgi:hypothetical protein